MGGTYLNAKANKLEILDYFQICNVDRFVIIDVIVKYMFQID